MLDSRSEVAAKKASLVRRFLICGLGSIGQRHIRILKALLGTDIEIAAFRTRNLDILISDRLKAETGVCLQAHYDLLVFDDISDALAWGPEAVFVTNPIFLHVDTALQAVAHGMHVFIEKPLGNSLLKVDKLISKAQEQRVSGMVGYQLRFHPGYQKIKAILDQGILGGLTSADLHFGEWLPGMHPYEDYRTSHAARSDQGGGVILCLSHEIDMAYWLFGRPSEVFARGGHLSSLEIDVEDCVNISMSCGSEGSEFPVNIHLDFLQKPMRKFIHVIGENGSLFFDYTKNQLEVNMLTNDDPQIISFAGFERNDMFMAELEEFINSCKESRPSTIPLKDGAVVLAICLAAKRSLKTRNFERLEWC